MIRTLVTLALAIVLTALAANSISAQKGYDLFQQALAKERAEGRPLEAIALYQQAIKEAGADRALIAKALVQMAGCYERIGSPEAKKMYERVVNEFTDQTDAVAAARVKLTPAAPPPADKSPTVSLFVEPVARPVSLPAGAMLSPDGQYVALPEGGDISVENLATKETRRLTAHTDTELPCSDPVWSHDSKQIAYAWCFSPASGQSAQTDIRVAGVAGGVRVIYPKSEHFAGLLDWSPDGRSIMTWLGPAGNQLTLVSVADGSTQVMSTYGPGRLGFCPDRPRFSPDSRYFVQGLGGEGKSCDLYITPMDGSGERVLIEHPAEEKILAWTPDGHGLLFLSDRAGTNDIWLVGIENGRVDGLPQRVKRDVGDIDVVGFTTDGALYYQSEARASQDVFVASLDPATGKVASRLGPVALSNIGRNAWPQWSPDGRQLAYKSGSRTPAPAAPGDKIPAPFDAITVLSVETGEQRPVRPRMDGGMVHAFSWAPDGHTFLVGGGTGAGPRAKGVFKVDRDNGATSTLVSSPMDTGVQMPSLLPDGHSVVFAIKWQTIVVRNLDTGEQRTLFETGSNGSLTSLCVSPDGKQIAFRNRLDAKGNRAHVVVTVSDGRSRTVGPTMTWSTSPNSSADQTMTWSPDGRYLVYADQLADRKGWQFWRVPVAGGPPESLGLTLTDPNELVDGVTVSPNGRSLAIGLTHHEPSGTFVLEHFLPAAERQRAAVGGPR
jgi:Tol biopolymer transport system component